MTEHEAETYSGLGYFSRKKVLGGHRARDTEAIDAVRFYPERIKAWSMDGSGPSPANTSRVKKVRLLMEKDLNMVYRVGTGEYTLNEAMELYGIDTTEIDATRKADQTTLRKQALELARQAAAEQAEEKAAEDAERQAEIQDKLSGMDLRPAEYRVTKSTSRRDASAAYKNIRRLLDICGTVTTAAEAIGVSSGALSGWRKLAEQEHGSLLRDRRRKNAEEQANQARLEDMSSRYADAAA